MPLQTDAQLKVYLDANIKTNYNREITGAKHNYWGTDIIDSKLNKLDASFLILTDTPSSYSGQSLKLVRVNSGETGLEFYSSSTSIPTLQQVTDAGATTDNVITFDDLSNILLLGNEVVTGYRGLYDDSNSAMIAGVDSSNNFRYGSLGVFGSDGGLWISGSGASFGGSLTINTIDAHGSPATVFLTQVGGLIKSRTAAQVLSDIGAGGGSMVYPSAGIALSTGAAWGTSITNNSANWNTAYGWGNHAGLYEPVLGNPASNGYVLSSTTAGVRSWVAMATSGVTITNYGSNKILVSDGTATGITARPATLSDTVLGWVADDSGVQISMGSGTAATTERTSSIYLFGSNSGSYPTSGTLFGRIVFGDAKSFHHHSALIEGLSYGTHTVSSSPGQLRFWVQPPSNYSLYTMSLAMTMDNDGVTFNPNNISSMQFNVKGNSKTALWLNSYSDQLSIMMTSGTSSNCNTLIGGSLGLDIGTITNTNTIDGDYSIYMWTSGTAGTIYLPSLSSYTRRVIFVVNPTPTAVTVTVAASGSDKVDGGASVTIAYRAARMFIATNDTALGWLSGNLT